MMIGPPGAAPDSQTALAIENPPNGAVLNRHDGRETPDGLLAQVSGSCPPGAAVSLNRQPASIAANRFSSELLLTKRRNRIRAETTINGQRLSDEIVLLWDWQSFKRYRFSVDDNIMFLKDLGLYPHGYNSLFDHWYLAFWRRIHQQFGTKIHLNIYYQTDAFDLTQMPDKWRDEWEANAGWLHLSFHALADKPDRPYRNATYAQIAHDHDLVMGHIRRFAGNEVTSRVTTLHWAECPKHAVRALRDRGIDILIGLFDMTGPLQSTGYYFDVPTCRYVNTRDYFYDPQVDMTYLCCDMVVNNVPLVQIAPALEKQAESPHTGELMELLIHEQYFREDLPGLYQPDAQDRVRRALEWVTQQGYQPIFWGEGFCGNQAPPPVRR